MQDEVNFIMDSKEEPKVEYVQCLCQATSYHSNSALCRRTKTPATIKPPSPEVKRSKSPQPRPRKGSGRSQDIKKESEPPEDKSGVEEPPRHTSKLDPNGNPVHPATNKPILSTDFDTDFTGESGKPWRKPGADITDYFNYGFDEFTWASYCLKQQQMPKEVKEINQQAEQMKAFVEGIPGGGMPGMPGVPTGPSGGGAPGGMPGMPSEGDMQQMFNSMMAQGMDPSSMDQNQFMAMMMGGMGQNQAPPAPQGGGFGGGGGGGFDQGGGGGFDGGGRGGGGRGRGRGRRGNW